jgi:hypothetical protein
MKLFIAIAFWALCPINLCAQEGALQPLPRPLSHGRGELAALRFIRQTGAKATKYYGRINNKTEKALQKLARWEGKIKALLEKTAPETAQRLFAGPQTTFAGMLERYRKGRDGWWGHRANDGWWGHQPWEEIANNYGKTYDGYRDRLTNTMGYLASPCGAAAAACGPTLPLPAGRPLSQGEGKAEIGAKGAAAAYQQLQKLDSLVDNTEALQQFIKERKRQLAEAAVKYLGKSRWAKKMDKDSYYYMETLRNYKSLFGDERKAEQLAVRLLQKIPGFEGFLQRNSAVAGLFGFNTNVDASGIPNLSGLQTRAGMTALLQNSGITAQALQQNMQAAQAQLNQLKDRVMDGAWDTHHGGGDGEPPSFRPNNQKTKTFWQRLEYTANIGFGRINPLATGRNATATADIALGIGYKLNDRSTVGIGASYKLGMGSIRRVRFSGQGIGLRSYIDWKLKKQFYVSGGYELNHLPAMQGVRSLTPNPSPTGEGGWQRSGLIGICKKTKLRTKWARCSSIQLLYDFLHARQRPVGQAWVFRLGYSF